MTARPWHKRWHGNALVGTRSLSLELRGAYQTLQDLMYDAGGPIRLEERRICGEFDCDIRVFKRVIAELIAADKIRLWSDGRTVWIVNDRMLKELKVEGFEPQTCAGLSPNLRDKFGIANAELSPKSVGKPKKNNATPPKKTAEKGPLEEEEEEAPLKSPKGDKARLFELEPDDAPDPVEVAYAEWNAVARRCRLPVAKGLDDARRRAIAKRLKEGGLEGWREALVGVERSAFCRGLRPGSDGRFLRADLGFVCQAKSFPRLREGFYGDDAPRPASNTPAARFPGPADLRAAVVAVAGDEDFAVAYLDPCVWQEVPSQALIARNAYAAEKLNRVAGRILTHRGIEVLTEAGKAAA